ncbi:hypothetical protein MLD38_018194 [Melastoma candidum]|uniref:Uncharacterized protein n=1 Tax=Melastoma candidum TaxID=119954 RepID=A0ACB9QT41_9MYRT|nr:hypothetical protein MLD38_018194 [Melastoma candidum]
MTAQVFVLMVLVGSCVVAAQKTSSNVTLGTSLSPRSSSPWLSPSGLYAMGFFAEGSPGFYKVGIFLAGIPERTIVWTANRDDPPVTDNFTLVFTAEGQLFLQSPQGDQTSIAAGLQLVQYASMLDSGNFAIFDVNGNIIWQSFSYPTDCLIQTQPLLTGNQLFSSMAVDNHATGIFRLKMQHDGNLIQYPINTPDTAPYSYYTSWTDGKGDNVSLRFDIDGHLYLMNSFGSNIRNITPGGLPTKGMTYMFRLDPDGLMRLYSHNLTQNTNWSVVWNSTSDKCDPKGLCGLNGYCVLVNNDAECRCIPGFDFVMPGNWSAGCARNTSDSTCASIGAESGYSMQAVDNSTWEDDSYSTMVTVDKQSCSSACLGDCNCEAALFSQGQCRKQRLPLRYGRRQVTDPTSALIKVGPADMIVPGRNFPQGNRKEVRKDVLIVGASLAGIGFIVMVISLFVIYRGTVWTYRKICDKIDIELGDDVAPRSFSYAQLEIITDNFKEQIGRGRNVNWELPKKEAVLQDWVTECCLNGNVQEITKLDEKADRQQFGNAIRTGLWCIMDEATLRPTMKKVLWMLEGNTEVPMPPLHSLLSDADSSTSSSVTAQPDSRDI